MHVCPGASCEGKASQVPFLIKSTTVFLCVKGRQKCLGADHQYESEPAAPICTFSSLAFV